MTSFFRRYQQALLMFGIALLLGLLTYKWQERSFGQEAQSLYQIPRHQAILDGVAGNPWQYRVLSAYMVEGVIRVYEGVGLAQPDASFEAFYLVRVVQNILMFWLAMRYYQLLGISLRGAILGAAMMAWAMTHIFMDSDLQFNTFFDVIFYLLAASAILKGHYWAIVPITFFAAWNRETSGLIPFMLLAQAIQWRPVFSINWRVVQLGALALGIYGLIFVALRYFIYDEQALILPHGQHPGVELFRFNMERRVTWELLLATLNITPILALLGYRNTPEALTRFGWVMVPIWFAIHAYYSVMAETRLFLVPLGIVLIPMALCGVEQVHPQDSSTNSGE